MGGHEFLLGIGDSSFSQLPRPSVLSRQLGDNSSNGTSNSSSSDPPVLGKIHQIACGSTAAFACSAPGSLLEWGTDVYGERLSTELAVQHDGESSASAAATSPLNHPLPVVLPLQPMVRQKPPAIKLIACGAHFVVAALEPGGCVSWGGGRDARKSLGRGGCDNCGQCSKAAAAAERARSCWNSGSKPAWMAEPFGLGGAEVKDLAAGDDHAIAVCGKGTAWAWGRDDCGQLGSGPAREGEGDAGAGAGGACVPVKVSLPAPSVVRAAACGRDHSALLTSDGRVWTFGSSLHGQLGLGSVGETSSTPAVVESLEGVGTMRRDGSFTGVASLACGAWHTAALSTTGDVYAWGWARFGALGPSPPGNQPSSWRKTGAGGGSGSGGGGGGGGDRKGAEKSEKSAPGVAAEEDEEGEVRPLPGLVDGLDAVLSDDGDNLVSVSCGARYTLALSRKKRALVWGQVAPPKDYGGGGAGRKGSPGGSGGGTKDSFSTPRELKPEELLRAAAAADAAPGEPANGGETGRHCSGESMRNGAPAAAVVGKHGGGEGRRWEISTAGCGPWYLVLGLEEGGQGRGAGPVQSR